MEAQRGDRGTASFFNLDFKLLLFWMLHAFFWVIPSISILCANISEHTVCSIFIGSVIRCRWVANATPQPLYYWERLDTHHAQGWVGHRASLERYGKFQPQWIRSPEHPAPSKSLYWLCSPCLSELSSKETKEMLDDTYSLKLSDMIITQQYLTTFQNHIIDSQWQQYSHCRKESAHLIQGIYKPCVYRHHIHFLYITAVKLVLKEYGSHWPSTCYALFCQKRSDYTTGIKNYCFLH